jgi:anti-sigma factor RsiW
MTCRETLDRLDDLIDGRLAAAERQAIRGHLAGCLACSRELAALRRLQGRAAELPAVAPRRDLWPAIRERIESAAEPAEDGGAPTDARLAPARRWWPLAAAATLAVAVLLPRLASRPAPDGRAMVRTPADATPRVLLLETLEARRGELPAESVRAFESDLEILDDAIREIEGALELSPESRRLRLLLAERRQQEAELLKLLARA